MPNYFSFQGRLTRRGWWLHSFLIACFAIALLMALITLFDDGSPASKNTNIAITAIAWIWMQLSISGQRLHDTDRSAKWLLTFLLPSVGTGLMIYFCGIAPGNSGDNQYGPNPRNREIGPDSGGESFEGDEQHPMLARLNMQLASASPAVASPSPAFVAPGMPSHQAAQSKSQTRGRTTFGKRR